MASKQTELVIADLEHQIDLQDYSNHVAALMLTLLNKVDAELVAALMLLLADLDRSTYRAARLDSMLKDVRKINASVYAKVYGELDAELAELAKYELDYQHELFDTLKIKYKTNGVTARQVANAAKSRPMQGRLLNEWASGLEEGRARKVKDEIQKGIVEGKTNDEIVRKIRGTKAKDYKDGILEIGRRDAENVVRTAVQHTAATGRDEFYAENEDILAAEQWVSTLDNRTSSPCRLRDGRRYTVGRHRPIGHAYPWGAGPGRFHFCCRSTAIPILKGFENEPLFGERATANGPVNANVVYSDWLKRQPAVMQDSILGKMRGELLRKGKLNLTDLYNSKGQYLSLEQLKKKNKSAFERIAGNANP